jgi:1-acyl-sn-glycerol-3-phosphate acyltransferase
MFVRRILRLSIVIAIFAYSIVELVLTRPHTRPERAAWLTRFCRRLLRRVGITISTVGAIPTRGAVISNHLTFVDIVAHASLRPTVFVSKVELLHTPVLGWISKMAGTVYVARGAGGSAAKAAEGMAKGFRDGLPVTFFPEGGTFPGDVPAAPFRSGLLAETLAAGEPVTASFLRYELSAEDLAEGSTARADLYWGDKTLPVLIWRLMGLKRVQAIVRFDSAPIAFPPQAFEDRKIAAEIAHEHVVALSGSSLTPAAL